MKWNIMENYRQVLINETAGLISENYDFELKERGLRIQMRSLHGGRQEGVRVLRLDNGDFSLNIIPTRGMGIWNGKCGDVDLGWNGFSRVPVHPSFVPLSEPGGFGWLDGFNEWFVRCGLESNGSPEFNENGSLKYGLHGKIANIPTRKLEVFIDLEKGEIGTVGTVEESRMFFKKLELKTTISMKIGTNILCVKDIVTNLSDEPGEYELLYHINNGMPFVGKGTRFAVPFERMAPRTPEALKHIESWDLCGPEEPGNEEVVYFFDPKAEPDGTVPTLMIASGGERGMLLTFNKKQLPYFSLWKLRKSNKDGYVTGMEPSVNFPNTKSFEKSKGRVPQLGPGESREHLNTVEILRDAASVQKALKRIESLGKGKIMDAVYSEWSE